MRNAALILAAALALHAADEIPRPEHPMPQFQRAEWQNLNGKWEFEFDDANAGLDEHWAAGAKRFSRAITVPFAFETPKSGIGDTSFHPWVWYRRTFSVPENWKNRRIMLRFTAVDYRAMVWVNAQMAGTHEGGSTPFSFDITPLLKQGPNVITVRAEDPPTDRSIPRGKQYWEPRSRGIFYNRTSGIWQTVWLEAVSRTHLSKIRITPAMDGIVRFDAKVARDAKGTELRVNIRAGGEQVAAGMGRTGDSGDVAAITGVGNPRLWSPDQPNLYDVTLELRRGETVLDKVESYFGFRTVGTEGGRVTLNGRPIYLKMVLDQGYWPESNLTPPSDEAMQYDIRMTKEMGFNGARKHQKIEDPRFLYWADKMGFLVSSEIANAYVFDESYVQRFQKEWVEAVERDYSHPSVIMWVPINESWGVPNLRDPRQQNHLKAMYAMTKSLDGTRPVIDNDGWQHTDMTDLFAVHNYARTGELLLDAYKDAGKPSVPFPPSGGVPALAPGYKYNGTPILLSEFGGIAFIPEGHKVPAESWGYSGVEKTEAAALDRLRGLYAALRKLPNIAGICYTQITDVEQEINGLMTYDRKPKFDVKVIKEMNDSLR